MTQTFEPDAASQLGALSPLDGRYARAVNALRAQCSEFALIRYRVRVEVRWLEWLAALPSLPECPALSERARAELAALVENFSAEDAARVKALERETRHDVKAVEYFLRERLRETSEAHANFLHFACTSEDINNLAYALMLHDVRARVLLPQQDALLETLGALSHAHAERPLLALTHGQPASPTTLGKEFANVAARLARARRGLARVTVTAKWNGASGNYNAHLAAAPGVDWPATARAFVEDFGLAWNALTTQIEPHDALAEFCDAQARANRVLLDFARDVWGYIARGVFRQRVVAGEVGSSTMPHKVNPIDFENAEGNFGVANALLHHLAEKLPVSRFQRDLSDSTVLRNLGVAFGHSVLAGQALARGLERIEVDDARCDAELGECWELLAEAVQTVMRRHGVPEPYEKLKALTRGRRLTAATLQEFIAALPIPAEEKARLGALTPQTYTGCAAELARAFTAATDGAHT